MDRYQTESPRKDSIEEEEKKVKEPPGSYASRTQTSAREEQLECNVQYNSLC